MQVSDGEDDNFIRLDNVNQSVRDTGPGETGARRCRADAMRATLGDALPRLLLSSMNRLLEARRLGGVPFDRLIQLGGGRTQ